MTITTGIDMLEIGRMAKSLRSKRFAQRCFSPQELEQFAQQGCRPNYLAGCFCAKEAFAKAMGTGIRGFSLNEVTLLRDNLGKPYLTFSGNARSLVEQQGLSFSVSISHTKEHVIAVVVAYTL